MSVISVVLSGFSYDKIVYIYKDDTVSHLFCPINELGRFVPQVCYNNEIYDVVIYDGVEEGYAEKIKQEMLEYNKTLFEERNKLEIEVLSK